MAIIIFENISFKSFIWKIEIKIGCNRVAEYENGNTLNLISHSIGISICIFLLDIPYYNTTDFPIPH